MWSRHISKSTQICQRGKMIRRNCERCCVATRKKVHLYLHSDFPGDKEGIKRPLCTFSCVVHIRFKTNRKIKYKQRFESTTHWCLFRWFVSTVDQVLSCFLFCFFPPSTFHWKQSGWSYNIQNPAGLQPETTISVVCGFISWHRIALTASNNRHTDKLESIWIRTKQNNRKHQQR